MSILTVALQGQEQLHTRRAKLAEAYQQAKELVQIGNLYQSEEILSEIISKDKSFDEAILLLHEVYLKRDEAEKANAHIGQYSQELEKPFLNKMLVLQANYSYQMGKYEQADKLLSNVIGEVFEIEPPAVDFLKKAVDFSIQELNKPLNIQFEQLPHPLNKFSQQYFPSITSRGQLVFTMRDQLGRGDENIYTSYKEGENEWTEPTTLSYEINTDRNEGTASISADGRTLVFTSCNRPNNIGSCDMYISYLRNDQWTSPELLGTEVNSEAWDSQPSLSANGNKLYFVSTRDGGYGKQDIWVSERIGGGWTQAVNLGLTINTIEDDCSPFIYLDGETLIFSSKGRIGLGGFDLFKSTLASNNWSEPENLGYPINNSFDQIGYCISFDQWAYFSSSDESGKIFLQRFRVPEALVPEIVLETEVFGRVIDAKTGELISALVSKMNNGDTLVKQNAENGRIELGENSFTTIFAEKRGYWTNSISHSDFMRDSTIRLSPIEKGVNLLKEPIEFEFDSHKLLEEAYPELNRIVDLLKKQPGLEVEIQGHTDEAGSGEYNQVLSECRAKSVYEYISRKLGSNNRLTFRGYGESLPVSGNRMAGNQHLNRRVEIVTR